MHEGNRNLPVPNTEMLLATEKVPQPGRLTSIKCNKRELKQQQMSVDLQSPSALHVRLTMPTAICVLLGLLFTANKRI